MQSKEGIGLEFFFIICAVVGGCLLTGGYGSVIGTFFGACILGMVQLGVVVRAVGQRTGRTRSWARSSSPPCC